ncbi:MAG TPA: ABC transporter ATP-binding protein [Woeseiaceae bacterium]|nr:ABC transporter ATP-binding protein [Woeseiaceae bacterium]
MSIALEQISKHYDGTAAVNDVTVDIAEGEFFVLLGPSGSGKSTLLRAIAGLTTIDHGRIVLHGRDVSSVPAKDRQVGFVFQNYALFRHMTIADNIEFALRARRVRVNERRRRRAELLALVALEGMDNRLPAELSGGQQQRVAVARALAHEPRVLLLDEPFGALDARIRDELRRAIREIQRAVGITTILVTHDQEEAFTMADRLGVMDRGRLQEVGEPRALYTVPRTRFVATFLGAANLLLGHDDGGGVRIGDSVFRPNRRSSPATVNGTEATIVIRPEDIAIAHEDESAYPHPIGTAAVTELEFVGSSERIRLKVTSSDHLQSALSPDAGAFTIEASRNAHDSETFPLVSGQPVAFGAKRIHVLSTRISTMRLIAGTEAAGKQLRESVLVRDLADRMHIVPSVRVTGADGKDPLLSGLAVVALEDGQGLAGAVRVLQAGACQVLAIGNGERPVERLLIYTQPSRPARDGALSAAGSLLRHMNIDATLLVRADERFMYGRRYRYLLDIRESALRVHGVDVRTESFRGNIVHELALRLRSSATTLLLVGVTSTASGRVLIDGLGKLVSREACAAILLTSARGEPEQRPVWPEFRRYAVARGAVARKTSSCKARFAADRNPAGARLPGG